MRLHPRSTLFPYTTLFRSARLGLDRQARTADLLDVRRELRGGERDRALVGRAELDVPVARVVARERDLLRFGGRRRGQDRKSTRLNSSHVRISYAVFCLKK